MPDMPKRKLVAGKSFYFGGVMILVIALIEGFEYSRLESTPRNMTARESVSELQTSSRKHWVQMTGLQLDCSKPVQEMENGKVSRTFYIATDEAKQQTFIIEYDGACTSDSAHSYQGMLEPATVDYISKQISAAGVTLPAGRIPYLEVGDNPAGLLHAAVVFSGLGLLVLGGAWWSRRDLRSPRT